ncbi:MAG: major capsid protein [Microviridae sp.]|nr:MAG: major capsid protein [Microviridae sp.]
MLPNFKQKTVDVHQFAMVPKADIPRSSFSIQSSHKTTFDAGYLVPVYVDEVVPGDTFNLRMTAFARLATPLFPIMDNLHLDSFFFFIPNRLVWSNWKKFMGEQATPASSISFSIPQVLCPAGGYAINSLQDYMGLPTVGQVTAGNQVTHSALFTRAYNLCWNEWFRDENLQDSVVVDVDDGPDVYTDYSLLRRGKRKDYFTGALPWPQKGATSVSLPLGTSATVRTQVTELVSGAQEGLHMRRATAGAAMAAGKNLSSGAGTYLSEDSFASVGTTDSLYPSNLYADLSTATAATINQLRQSFQIQRLLERDARGGTRYTEIVRAHFGVVSPDARLQRPEYLGGGSTPIVVSPIAQTSATGLTGGSTPVGNLAAAASVVASGHGFTQSFTEHGIILGLVSVRADLSYQQGMRKMWRRLTRYDFYFPAFAMLGEQSIYNWEIYCKGDSVFNDGLVFGYQERWSEMRYFPSMITGLFRSTAASTIDPWHLSQKFTSLPLLDTTFIQDTPPVERVVAVGSGAAGKQFIFDSFFDVRAARPLPMYSVPGMIDHF